MIKEIFQKIAKETDPCTFIKMCSTSKYSQKWGFPEVALVVFRRFPHADTFCKSWNTLSEWGKRMKLIDTNLMAQKPVGRYPLRPQAIAKLLICPKQEWKGILEFGNKTALLHRLAPNGWAKTALPPIYFLEEKHALTSNHLFFQSGDSLYLHNFATGELTNAGKAEEDFVVTKPLATFTEKRLSIGHRKYRLKRPPTRVFRTVSYEVVWRCSDRLMRCKEKTISTIARLDKGYRGELSRRTPKHYGGYITYFRDDGIHVLRPSRNLHKIFKDFEGTVVKFEVCKHHLVVKTHKDRSSHFELWDIESEKRKACMPCTSDLFKLPPYTLVGNFLALATTPTTLCILPDPLGIEWTGMRLTTHTTIVKLLSFQTFKHTWLVEIGESSVAFRDLHTGIIYPQTHLRGDTRSEVGYVNGLPLLLHPKMAVRLWEVEEKSAPPPAKRRKKS